MEIANKDLLELHLIRVQTDEVLLCPKRPVRIALKNRPTNDSNIFFKILILKISLK